MEIKSNIVKRKGNIFTTNAETIVNAVNCVGVMGAGIAFEFRLRYPIMYQKYVTLCDEKKIDIGKLWIYKTNDEKIKKILSFPTKKDWKHPTKEEYLEKGLNKFRDTYQKKKITSIAFPLLGTGRGGISPKIAEKMLYKYLDGLDGLKVEIWYYDPNASDDLFEIFKEDFKKNNLSNIGIRKNILEKISLSLENDNIKNFSTLIKQKGIGEKSIEKIFEYLKKNQKIISEINNLKINF